MWKLLNRSNGNNIAATLFTTLSPLSKSTKFSFKERSNYVLCPYNNIFSLFTDWSDWFNETGCMLNQGTCGSGSIFWARNCTPNDTRYPNDTEKCKEEYPSTEATNTTHCFINCYSMLAICLLMFIQYKIWK